MNKKNILYCFILLLFLGACSSGKNNKSVQLKDIDKRVNGLLNKMTLEEKVGQMTNIGLTAVCKGPFWNAADSLEIDTVKLNKMLLTYHVGSIQNKGKYPPSVAEWTRLITKIQDVATKESRLGIPVLMGIDGVHGANYTANSTLFPQQIACAATWNPECAEKLGEITSYELRASSTPWNYAPVLDVSWQPLWGRVFETFGEDTYMASIMGEAFVKGSQGDDLSNPEKTAVCLKHFIGYGNPYNGKDRSPVLIPKRDLKQYYLPPFKAAIDAGALSIMINSGSVNGIPGHANHELLTNTLKGELGFTGFTISDWEDVVKLVNTHFVARDVKEAVKISVLAGMDMCMVPYDESFAIHLVELVKEGSVPMERIDDAVRRILNVKFKLGIFETPVSDPEMYDKFGSEEFANASYEAAKECITLLKNDENILPLTNQTKVFVTGPTANSINYLNGAWSRTWSGNETEYNDKGKATVLEAIKNKLGKGNVSYAEGVSFDKEINIREAVNSARKSDVIVICIGEKPATEIPSNIEELEISDTQIKLVKELYKTGKPIVLVMLQGRPRIIREIEGLAKAIIMGYLPGQEGGRAIADVLFGDCNPSGRLPYTYPRFSGSLWKYNHKGSDEIGAEGFSPQYEFGEGLSYTTFSYGEPELSSDTIQGENSLEIKIQITNTGKIFGKEVIQLYIRDLVASISPDVKKLVRFEKVGFQPGETKTISFQINEKDLAFVGKNNQWTNETGDFQILIGGHPKALKAKTFYYDK
jgi:beta-glucosidase